MQVRGRPLKRGSGWPFSPQQGHFVSLLSCLLAFWVIYDYLLIFKELFSSCNDYYKRNNSKSAGLFGDSLLALEALDVDSSLTNMTIDSVVQVSAFHVDISGRSPFFPAGRS